MNAKQINHGSGNVNRKNTFTSACVNSCKEVVARINQSRETLLTEARETLNISEQLLRLALNEAEALARQTLYPHLVFPALAAEKVRNITQWNKRQRLLAR